MKKEVFAIFSLIFVTLSLIVPASAQIYWQDSSNQALYWIQNHVGPIFGVFLGGGGELLFERVLLFFILIAFIFVILNRMSVFRNNLAVIWIVTVSVSLLATRFLADSALMKNALLPYTVLGVSLSAAIPLVIYFFFVHSFEESSTLRKVLWIFFIVVFLGIWADRQNELGDLSYIYILTGVVAAIFLFADGTIRRAMQREILKQNDFRQKEEQVRLIRNRMSDLTEDLNKRHSISPDSYKRQMRELDQQLKYWMKK